MSYASGTTHYNLPQTVGSDKRDWTDTNQAFSDIDAAIYGAAQGASAATSAIQTINGQIETITAAQAVDEGNISTLAGKVSTLESTVGTQGAAIADVRQDLQDNIESNHEASATSTHAYNIGDTFYYNDVLYKATASIAIGGTIVPSTNCTAVTVMSELAPAKNMVADLSGLKFFTKTITTTTYGSLTAFIADIADKKIVSGFLHLNYSGVDISEIIAGLRKDVAHLIIMQSNGAMNDITSTAVNAYVPSTGTTTDITATELVGTATLEIIYY